MRSSIPSLTTQLLTLVLLAATELAMGAEEQQSCAIGQIVSLSLSHRKNSTGHTILNGRMEHPAEALWQLDVDLRTSTCRIAHSQTKIVTFGLSASSSARRVPPGYVQREGFGYFRLGTHALNWTAARDACAREGAHLAFANSQEEALMLTRDFNFAVSGTVVQRYAWYGASDIVEEGKFVTVTGVALEETGYIMYVDGAPNGRNSDNCIFLNKEYPSLLDDGNCSVRLAYVCKIPL